MSFPCLVLGWGRGTVYEMQGEAPPAWAAVVQGVPRGVHEGQSSQAQRVVG